jgi:hypothetical protein
MTWDLLAIHVLEPRPLILYGHGWSRIVEVLRNHLILSVDHAFSMITTCSTPEEASRTLAKI